jgi:hypothetical protein
MSKFGKSLNGFWKMSKNFSKSKNLFIGTSIKNQISLFAFGKNKRDKKYSFHNEKYQKSTCSMFDRIICYCTFLIISGVPISLIYDKFDKKQQKLKREKEKIENDIAFNDNFQHCRQLLLRAIVRNDINDIREYKRFVNTKIIASSIKHVDKMIVMELITEYRYHNKTIPEDNDVLSMAIKKGDDELVRFMLSNGFNPTENTIRCLIDSKNRDLIDYFRKEIKMSDDLYQCAFDRAIENKMYEIADNFYFKRISYIKTNANQMKTILKNNDIDGLKYIFEHTIYIDMYEAIDETIEDLNLETIELLIGYFPNMKNNLTIKTKLTKFGKSKISLTTDNNIIQSSQTKKYGIWPFTWTSTK